MTNLGLQKPLIVIPIVVHNQLWIQRKCLASYCTVYIGLTYPRSIRWWWTSSIYSESFSFIMKKRYIITSLALKTVPHVGYHLVRSGTKAVWKPSSQSKQRLYSWFIVFLLWEPVCELLLWTKPSLLFGNTYDYITQFQTPRKRVINIHRGVKSTICCYSKSLWPLASDCQIVLSVSSSDREQNIKMAFEISYLGKSVQSCRV